MKLTEILSPLSEDNFLRDYYGQVHLHLPGNGKDLLRLLSWQQLSKILREHPFDEQRLRLIKNGNVLPPSAYLRRRSYRNGGQYSVVDTGGLETELRNGAVLNLVAIDQMSAPIRAMALSLESALGGFVSASVYAAVTPTRGLNVHSDDHDVLVFHLDGKKQWQLFLSPEESLKCADSYRKPDWEYLLEPGDVLYIPQGLQHSVETRAAPSLHLTFAVTHRRTVDFLVWLNRKQGVFQAEFRQPLSVEAKTDILKQMKEQLLNFCNERFLEKYFREQNSLLGNEDSFTVFPEE